ncbi:MAG: hypothetical protein IT190_09440, partial [Microbacteriaceae bacterium]|nr:hypothetical protein [Microbacteriaceae bacterium]
MMQIQVSRPRPATALAFLFALAAVPPAPAQGQVQRVKDTVHNLSVSGPGPIRASGETEVCIFCHTPHNASLEVRPLWNRSVSHAPYTIYQSSSMRARPGQPTGSSKLCLSCHDGTIALGSVLSRDVPIALQGGVTVMPQGPSNLGTDLSDDHPISFSYDAAVGTGNPELLSPGAILPPVDLDRNGEVQCTSCHEPHDNSFGKFLVRPNESSALCRSCHTMRDWSSSAHGTSAAPVTADVAALLGAEVAATSQNACRSCHATHGAEGRPWLLARANITSTCIACHSGRVARWDIEGEMRKLSGHGLSTEGVPALHGSPYLEGNRVS